MRKVIAERMHASLQSAAQLTITMKADVTEPLALKTQVKETIAKRYDSKLTITDFTARAVILALKNHPEMNSAFLDDTIVTYPEIHLGIATAVEKGLIVPVIRNAESKSLIDLAKEIKEKQRQQDPENCRQMRCKGPLLPFQAWVQAASNFLRLF